MDKGIDNLFEILKKINYLFQSLLQINYYVV